MVERRRRDLVGFCPLSREFLDLIQQRVEFGLDRVARRRLGAGNVGDDGFHGNKLNLHTPGFVSECINTVRYRELEQDGGGGCDDAKECGASTPKVAY